MKLINNTLMSTLYTQGVLAGITMTGSLPYNFPSNMTPNMGARDVSSLGKFHVRA